MAQTFASLALPLLSSLQLGSLFTWGLQGVLCVQVYNYYLSFPKDPLYMKTTVYSVLVLELLQTVLVTHDTWEIFVKGFGSFADLNDLRFLWFTLPILGGIAGLLCHLTFAYRISLLSESRIAGVIIAVPALLAGITGCVFGAMLHHAAVLSIAITTKHIYLVCGIWNGAGALCDVLIAAAMTYYLSRNSTGFPNTDLLITRITRLTIETGILTATASIASAALFVGFRQNVATSVYFIIPAIMITKLYAVTIVATFNNRPQAVGGPPPLSDIETYFDDSAIDKQYSRNNSENSAKEIRIGRTVVQQVWKDDVPMSHLKIYEEDSAESIKDDSESSRKVHGSLTEDLEIQSS